MGLPQIWRKDCASLDISSQKVFFSSLLVKRKANKTCTFEKQNSAVRSEIPLKLWRAPTAVHKTTLALSCPQHIDSPPGGPNQFLLFSDALPAWTCSGHRRHSSIRPGWLWLIWHQTINLFPLSLFLRLSSLSLSSSSSLCLLHLILLLFCGRAGYDEKVRVWIALTPRHVRVTTQSLSDLGEQLIRAVCSSIHIFDT